jgi:transposase, IS30 family
MNRYHQLSQQERYTITSLLISRKSDAKIARSLRRSPSTICRELARNQTHHDSNYRAELAHIYATARRRRGRRGSHFTAQQWQQVLFLLKEKWSPEQISNYLMRHADFTISHETIYKYILLEKKHGGTLFKHLQSCPKLAENAITPGILVESCLANGISRCDLPMWSLASSWAAGKEIP